MKKNIFLSLDVTKENQDLMYLFKKHEQFNLIDLRDVTDEKVTVIVNGPLTELATLLMVNWQLKDNIEQVLFVGGTDKYGDVTPVAEKNVYDDINSAQYVFLSGLKIVMFGLNVTRDLNNRGFAPLVYLNDPTIFETEECGVYVETKGSKTLGMTVTDLYSDKQFPDHNVEIVKSIDIQRYQQVIEKLSD